MASTRHSMAEAMAIQKSFEARYSRMQGVVGIGISMNKKRDDLALNVSVAKPAQAESLPKDFEGLDVVVDVVGNIEAF